MKKFYEDEHGDAWIRFRCKGICCKTTQRKTKKMIRVDCVNNHKNIGTLEKPTLVNKIDGSPLASGSSLGIGQKNNCPCHAWLVDGVFVDSKGNRDETLELLSS